MNPKVTNILNWIIIVLLSLQFVLAALPKFTGQWEDSFNAYGYPVFTMYLVGALELLAVIAFYSPRFRKAGAWIIIALMTGAAVTHLLNDENNRILQNLILVGLSVGLIYIQRFRQQREVSDESV